MAKQYALGILAQSPSMSVKYAPFSAVGYMEAVAVAQETYRTLGRSVTLHLFYEDSGTVDMYWYHRIAYGVAVDRNTNSGVPELQEVAR